MAAPCYAAHQFTIFLTGGRRPTIEGAVNLLDGTELLAWIYKPPLPDAQQRLDQGLTACGDDECFPASVEGSHSPKTVVMNGHFSIGPFSFGGAPFHPGLYPVEIDIIEGRTGFTCSGYFSKVQVE
jgi:hypothetical protein